MWRDIAMKDDWRIMGQDDYLMEKKLYFIKFQPHSEKWDHEHCEFCWATFSDAENDLHEGYCTTPDNSNNAYWICSKCYEDFKEDFKWKLIG